jgi:hypothetical protein
MKHSKRHALVGKSVTDFEVSNVQKPTVFRSAKRRSWPLSTFVATQHFGSYRSNSGHAADIEPTLMTHSGHRDDVQLAPQ